jgi:ABC-type metal ion transport system substrate-binding protein
MYPSISQFIVSISDGNTIQIFNDPLNEGRE